MSDTWAARDLLEGALLACDGAGSASDCAGSSDDEANLIDLIEEDVHVAVSASGASKRSRRRRKQPSGRQQTAGSYVMKLFDRSVDLACFPPDAALYAVCRAWATGAASQPSGDVAANGGGLTVPDVSSAASAADVALAAAAVCSGDVRHLPPPQPRERRSHPSSQQQQQQSDGVSPSFSWRHPELQLPRPAAVGAQSSAVFDSGGNGSTSAFAAKAALLAQNLSRWRRVRQLVRAEMRQDERRFAASFQVLDSLFLGTGHV